MFYDTFIDRPWKIPKILEEKFSKDYLENTLSAFSLTSRDSFYIIDYRTNNIIVSPLYVTSSFGYSKNHIEKVGLALYDEIIDADDIEWLRLINKEAYSVFRSYPLCQRTSLIFTYDLITTVGNNTGVSLRHKHVPYQLDKNGNLWLDLCRVSLSSTPHIPRFTNIVNVKTGEEYIFIDNTFQLSKTELPTRDDIQILKWMADDLTQEQICSLLSTSASGFKRRRQSLLSKLSAKTTAGAIHKAHVLGIL